MGNKVWGIVALALIVSLVGCGGVDHSATLQGTPQPNILPAGQLANIAQPTELLGAFPSRMASVQPLKQTGSSYLLGKSQRVGIEEISARFFPAWDDSTSGADRLAYAIYNFNLVGYEGAQEIVLSWGEEPTDYDNLWIGLGNWATDRWDWYACDSNNSVSFAETGYGTHVHPLTGDLLVTVMLLGSQQALLTKVQAGQQAMIPIEITGITPDPTQCLLHRELMLDVEFTGTVDAFMTYAWDFGGGATPNESTEQSPTVFCAPVGTHDCTVTVDNDCNDPCTYNFTLAVTTEQGDWWMLGRNAQHESRSPYIGAQTNNIKWTFDTEQDSYSSPVLAADGTIYLGSTSGYLYAVNPDGTEKWRFLIKPLFGIIHSTPAIAPDGTIYLSCGTNHLTAMNPDGTLRWNCVLNDDFKINQGSPAIATDGTIYFASTDRRVLALDPLGQIIWTYSTDDMVSSSPVIGDDGTIFVGCNDDNLHAITPEGNQKWLFPVGDVIRSAPTIGADGTIYFGCSDGNLYAVDQGGNLEWSYPLALHLGSSPAIGADGTIYIGSTDNKFCAISAEGELQWEFYSGGEFRWAVPAIGADGTIYIGCDDSKIYALDPEGNLKWSYTTGDWVRTSPAIGPDGTVYVGSFEGDNTNRLYAFGLDDPHDEGSGGSL